MSKVSEMLKKLGVSEELIKKISEEAKNGPVSVEAEASTDKESSECECPKCGIKFDPSAKKEEAPKKFSMVEEMMKARV